MKNESAIPVNDTDEMTTAGGPSLDKTRILGDYKKTNMPLSDAEIKERERNGWPPHDTDHVHEIVPIPEE